MIIPKTEDLPENYEPMTTIEGNDRCDDAESILLNIDLISIIC